MSKLDELEGIAQLTELMFSARSAEVQRLSAREKELRERFDWLEQQSRSALDCSAEVLSQRLTGMDVLYQVWVGRQMTETNTELAQVLAEKSMRLGELRKAFGKRDVAHQLLKRARAIRHPGAPSS